MFSNRKTINLHLIKKIASSCQSLRKESLFAKTMRQNLVIILKAVQLIRGAIIVTKQLKISNLNLEEIRSI